MIFRTTRLTGLASTSLATTVLAACLLVASGTASATGYPIGQPNRVDGGFSCRNFDTANLLTEITVTPVDGVIGRNDGTLDLTVVYYDSTDGWILDWYQENTGPVIRHVVIEDGDATAHSYTYDPATDHDRLLHADAAPRTPGGRALYKPLRRATFCYGSRTETPQYQGCPRDTWASPENHGLWPATVSPASRMRAVFGASVADDSFVEALNYSDDGDLAGMRRGLLREAAAAYVNSQSRAIRYPMTSTQVVDFTRYAHDSADQETILSLTATLAAYNQLNCPLGTTGNADF